MTTLRPADLPLIIQAPMAGGPTTPALVAAACEAGALGGLGAAYLSPEQIRADVAEIQRRTSRLFVVNLFVPGPHTSASGAAAVAPETIHAAQRLLAPFRRELGLPDAAVLPAPPPDFDAQLDAVLESSAPLVSFTFGLPSAAHLQRVTEAGRPWMGTVTTVAEALICRDAGASAVVVQGSEAGGHRGTFSPRPEDDALVGTLALVPAVVDALNGELPVIAAGGIADGRGIAAVLALGATAAQLGTVFLLCSEAGTSAPHRAALLAADEAAPVLTHAPSGRTARGLRNRLTEELRPHEATLPPFPVQNSLTADVRRAATAQNRPEFLSLWSGQGVGLVRRELPVAELVAELLNDTRRALARAAGRCG